MIERPKLTWTVQKSLLQQKQQPRLLHYHVNPDSDEYYGEHFSSQELLTPDFPTSYRNRETGKHENTIDSRSGEEEARQS